MGWAGWLVCYVEEIFLQYNMTRSMTEHLSGFLEAQSGLMIFHL